MLNNNPIFQQEFSRTKQNRIEIPIDAPPKLDKVVRPKRKRKVEKRKCWRTETGTSDERFCCSNGWVAVCSFIILLIGMIVLAIVLLTQQSNVPEVSYVVYSIPNHKQITERDRINQNCRASRPGKDVRRLTSAGSMINVFRNQSAPIYNWKGEWIANNAIDFLHQPLNVSFGCTGSAYVGFNTELKNIDYGCPSRESSTMTPCELRSASLVQEGLVGSCDDLSISYLCVQVMFL